jgi:hypothetical protein
VTRVRDGGAGRWRLGEVGVGGNPLAVDHSGAGHQVWGQVGDVAFEPGQVPGAVHELLSLSTWPVSVPAWRDPATVPGAEEWAVCLPLLYSRSMHSHEPVVFAIGPGARRRLIRRSVVFGVFGAGFVVLLLGFRQRAGAGVLLLVVCSAVVVSLRTVSAWTMVTDEGLTAKWLLGPRFIAWHDITSITDRGLDAAGATSRSVQLSTTRWLRRRRLLAVPYQLGLAGDPEYDAAVDLIHRTWAARTGRSDGGRPQRVVRHYTAQGFWWTSRE